MIENHPVFLFEAYFFQPLILVIFEQMLIYPNEH